jgi:hypothetical protein
MPICAITLALCLPWGYDSPLGRLWLSLRALAHDLKGKAKCKLGHHDLVGDLSRFSIHTGAQYLRHKCWCARCGKMLVDSTERITTAEEA